MENKREFGNVWAEINLDNLAYNIRSIREIVNPGTRIMAVLKANAYGFGAVEIARFLRGQAIDYFAVANLKEAAELRRAGIDTDILILGYTPDSRLASIIDLGLTQTIYSLSQARILSDLAGERSSQARIHIKLDTGMARIGFRRMEDLEEIMEISRLDNIDLEGVYTHFATGDMEDKSFAREQFRRYEKIVDKLEEKGLNISIKHVSNSADIMDLPDYDLDMVRAGIIMYGLYPSDEVRKENLSLRPVMTLKTKISHIKVVEAGVGIGYGLSYTTDKTSKIGTIALGYADGFSRGLSNLGEVGVGGQRAAIVGRICMDQTMIDLTGIEAELEDEVVLFNDGSNNYPTIEEMADKLGTINYEIVANLGRRVERVYILGGRVLDCVDYVLD